MTISQLCNLTISSGLPTISTDDNFWKEYNHNNGIYRGFFGKLATDSTSGVTAIEIKYFDIFKYIFMSGNGITIDGITVDCENNPNIRTAIQSISAGLSVKNCTIENHYADNVANVKRAAVLSTAPTEIDNCHINGSHNAIDITNNGASIKNTIIHEAGDTAISIDGAGAGIVIDHCTVYANFKGIVLENNAGTEIIKNCILNENTNGGIAAETALTANNCCITDTVSGATLSECITANPRFINTGYINPAAINLHLKSKCGGYSINSPCIGIADDDEDAGAYDVEYIFNDPTYVTSILIKPEKMNFYVKPVNAIKRIMTDGTVKTYKDSDVLYLECEWTALKKAEIDYLYAMCRNGGDVLIYPDPISYPSDYISMTLLYDTLQMSPEYYAFSGIGVQDVKITFATKIIGA